MERIFVIDVLSYDWNCPKFITPRFTAAEVQDAVAPLKARIAELESQLKLLHTMNSRPPLPPFTEETAIKKIQAAEDAWNSRDPERVSVAYTPDTEWRNRDVFLKGRAEVVEFLKKKWAQRA